MSPPTTTREDELIEALTKCSDILAMLYNAGAITTKHVLAGSSMKTGATWAREAVLEAQATLEKFQMP